jgi:PTH1 family peptidyl-tRNA hydrolase
VKLIVGLGNPGPAYAKNRHNVGYQCLELLAWEHKLAFNKLMFKAYTAQGTIANEKVLLARPLTFMNLSGQSVRPLLRWYRTALTDLLIVYDDLDLPLGKLRLRARGASAGHKGMQSIIESLGTNEFARMRIGIGHPTRGDSPHHVLSDFTAEEWITVKLTMDRAVAAIRVFIAEGISAAMNQFNPSPPGEHSREQAP